MVIYSGIKLGRSLCEILGIDPTNVYRIFLDCAIHKEAKVTVYEYASTDEGKLHKFADIIKHYEIKELCNVVQTEGLDWQKH